MHSPVFNHTQINLTGKFLFICVSWNLFKQANKNLLMNWETLEIYPDFKDILTVYYKIFLAIYRRFTATYKIAMDISKVITAIHNSFIAIYKIFTANWNIFAAFTK